MRIERDALGEVEIPDDVPWGAATQRAVGNFPVSGQPMPAPLLRGLLRIKACAARANGELGELSEPAAGAIEAAARALLAEDALDAFPVDVFQTGSGTSTNMNANEVIAHRAAGDLHPNDDVNRGQSSNDVMPTALHVAALSEIHERLLPSLDMLASALRTRGKEIGAVIKPGRTHLMDATPVRLRHEFSGWARQVELGRARVAATADGLAELAIGGTAVGTRLAAAAGFGERVPSLLAQETGLPFKRAEDPFEAQGARDAALHASAALRGVATSLLKIAGDLRLLASGPHTGIAELRLPAVQPGSSIMPAKVNPVICESVAQVAMQVIGNDAAVAAAVGGGQLELCATIPVIARNLLESIALLANASRLFADRCIAGIEVDAERCSALLEASLLGVTALVPAVGYDLAAAIAKEAAATGRPLREVALARSGLDATELGRLLDPASQLGSR